MATITTILASDIIASSRVTLNTNFANLNTDKVDINSTYADPAWITSLAGSKVTGNIGGNAATATALATARTIAGVSFNGTANIAIPSTGLSDSSDIVRGASSVASGQVLYGTGAGVAGTSAGITYSTGAGGSIVTLTGVSFGQLLNSVGDLFITNNAGAGGLIFRVQSVEGFRLATTTRNLLLGTTTDDGTNRLQVAGSVAVTGGSIGVKNGFGLIGTDNALGFVATAGQFEFRGTTGARLGTITSAGAFGVYNETPTTGATQLIVRAGAGQSTTNLTTWQNAAGGALASVTSGGAFFVLPTSSFAVATSSSFATFETFINQNGLSLSSIRGIAFSSTTDAAGGKDTGLYRNSSTALEVNNGTAGTFRDLYLRGVRPVGSTVANLPTASGNTGMMATVTDATVTTIGTTVAGGGGNTVLVWSNGTNWRIYAN